MKILKITGDKIRQQQQKKSPPPPSKKKKTYPQNDKKAKQKKKRKEKEKITNKTKSYWSLTLPQPVRLHRGQKKRKRK